MVGRVASLEARLCFFTEALSLVMTISDFAVVVQLHFQIVLIRLTG